MKKRNNLLFYIFFAIFVSVFIYTAYIVYNNYIIGAKAYNDIEEQANVSIVKNDTIQPIATDNEVSVVEEIDLKKYQYQEIISLDVDWTLFENTSVCGWIQIDGEEQVDYPVVQSEDNEYYLHHLYDGSESNQGSIFVDYRNEGFNNRHMILYGHNMKNGSMFSSIKNYQNQEYADEHRYVYIATSDGTRVFYVYSCHLTDANGENDGFSAYQVSFDGDGWQKWVKETQERSLITSDIEIPNKCNIITLSTCMSRGDKSERCVVHAIEVSNQKLVEINE